jgi:hypothetical protein
MSIRGTARMRGEEKSVKDKCSNDATTHQLKSNTKMSGGIVTSSLLDRRDTVGPQYAATRGLSI